MKMRRDETVYDRMKQNGGFISGGDHKILTNPGMRPKKPMMEEDPDESEESKGPPNLRNALEESTICGTCSDFEGMSCKKYGARVMFHQGCDDHSDLREEEEAEAEPAMAEEE